MKTQITQSVGRAAAKTFLQAFLGVLSMILVPVLMGWQNVVGDGGVIDIDGRWLMTVLLAAVGAGIASLISFAQNALK